MSGTYCLFSKTCFMMLRTGLLSTVAVQASIRFAVLP